MALIAECNENNSLASSHVNGIFIGEGAGNTLRISVAQILEQSNRNINDMSIVTDKILRSGGATIRKRDSAGQRTLVFANAQG